MLLFPVQKQIHKVKLCSIGLIPKKSRNRKRKFIKRSYIAKANMPTRRSKALTPHWAKDMKYLVRSDYSIIVHRF